MKLSFATLGCPSWDVARIARQAAVMGFEGVELRGAAGEHIGPDEPAAARARIRALFREQGVAIAAISGYSRFAVADEAAFRDNITQAVKAVEVARDIGCPVLRVFGGQLGDMGRDKGLARVIAGLKEVAPAAETAGVQLALETHDDWCRGENISAVLAGVASPALGICWDVGNSYFDEPLEETFRSVHGHVRHVHLKDAVRSGGRVHGRLPGQGEVDLRQALRLLKAEEYRGYLSFEWEKKWEPDLAEPEVAFPHFASFMAALMGQEGVTRG